MKIQSKREDRMLFLVFCVLVQALMSNAQDTDCRETWIRNSNTHATGGTKYALVYSEDQCFSVCDAQSNCVAIELNTRVYPEECWIFTNQALLNSSTFLTGYTQYVLVKRCSPGAIACRDRWELQMSSKGSGSGTLVSNIDNDDQCLNTCLLNPNCVSVDVKITTNPIQCYIHTNPADNQNPLYTQEYKLYILLARCDNISAGSTTTFGGGTSNNCWTTFPNQNSDFGVQTRDPALNSVDSCKQFCVNLPPCVAIDYDITTSPPCWIHNSSSNLLPANTYSSTTVTQYRLQRICNNIGDQSTPPFSSSSSVSSLDCWTPFQNQNSDYGVQSTDPTQNSVERCKQYCVNLPSCVAIDFDPTSSPPCWTHSDPSDLLPENTYFPAGVTQYRLRGNCLSSSSSSSSSQGVLSGCWTILSRTFADLGSAASFNTVDSCQAYCISLTNCIAIDYDTNASPQCWVHTDPNDLSPQYIFNKDSVTQYRLDRACALSSGSTTSSSITMLQQTIGDVPNSPGCWSILLQTQSIDAFDVSYSTLQDCQLYCISLSQCVAIDFDTGTSPPCWIHNDPNNLVNTYFAQSVNQYRINRTCLAQLPPGSSVSASSRTMLIATTTLPNQIGSICWITFQDQHSIGGSQFPYNDIFSCQNYCSSLPDCVAVDFDLSVSPPCWIHRNADDLLSSNIYSQQGILQYQIDRGCTRTSISSSTSSAMTQSSPGTSNDCWTAYPGTFADFGTAVAQASSSADTCKSYCVYNLALCVAVDYDTSASVRCWIHTDPDDLNPDNIYQGATATNYRLNRTCAVILYGNSTATPSIGSTFSGLSSGCLRWNVFPRTNSINGIQTQYTSLGDCLGFCDSQPACVAVDYDSSSSPPCWVHNSSSDLLPDNVYNPPTVTQYRISRGCSGTIATGPPSTATSITTTGSSLPTVSGGPACDPTWIRFGNQQSINGAHFLGIDTVADCLDLCTATPNCVAADFDTTTTDNVGCWLHMLPEDLWTNNTFHPNPVTQYIINRSCLIPETTIAPGCVTNWSFRNNSNANGGLNYFQYRTVADCQQLCLDLGNCLAIDFITPVDEVSGGCYIYNDPSLLTRLYDTPGVQHYTIVGTNCGPLTGAPGCAYDWSQPFYDRNIAGGIPTRDVTFADCQARCIYITSCIGIDVDYNQDAYAFCWLTVNSGALTAYPGVMHYELTRGASCPEVNTTTASTVTTLPTTAAVTGPYGICSYYVEIANANANGGVDQGIMTAERCTQSCIERYPFCVAADLRKTDSHCYHQNSLSGRQWNGCCTRYELVCYASTCNDSFADFANTVPSLPGTPQPTITTLDACRNACYSNRSCAAFVLAHSPNYQGYDCILSFSTVGSTTYSAAYDLYVREICHPTVAPTGQVTQPPTPPSGYCVLDIVFVVDNSGSIIEMEPPGVDNLELIKSFLRTVIQSPIQVGPYFDHVGLVKFESSAFVLYDLCQSQTLQDVVVNGINGLPTPAGETNTPEGLRLAYDMLYSASGCGRPNAQKVVVLLTDGQTTLDFRSKYTTSVNALKDRGTIDVAIGVTTAINMDDLRYFASADDDVSTLTGFDELIYVVGQTVNRMLVLCGRPTITTITRPQKTSPGSAVSTSSTSSRASSTSSSTTTTTTRTTTTPTTTTTTMTTTTTLPAPVARPFGFSASQSGTINAPSNPVPLNILVSSINSSYSTSTYSYTTPSIGIYFAEICVGLVAGKTARMSLVPGGGTTPAMGLVWESTIHNGAETACRGGLMQLMPSVTQQLYLDSGTVFSNNSETMLNVFSVSDAMTDAARQRTVHAVGNSSFGYAGVMPLVATIGPGASGVFDAAKSTYTCTESGLYFISFTAGSNPFQATRVELDGLKDESGENRTFELTRNTLKHNGVTTLAREVLVPCPAGTKLYLNVSFGDVVTPSTYQLITFSAFPYLPRYVAPQAWVLLKNYSSDTRNGPMDPFYFNIVAYNANNLYDEDSMTVTIRTPGYYYVYISTGTARNTPLYFALLRNSATLIVINHMTTTLDAEESVGHGVVVALNANDVLKVVGAMETYSFSSIIGEQTSFFGMLLYGL